MLSLVRAGTKCGLYEYERLAKIISNKEADQLLTLVDDVFNRPQLADLPPFIGDVQRLVSMPAKASTRRIAS